MTSTVTIGLAQWLPRCNSHQDNLRDALGFVGALADQGCTWVVLPELWPCGYDPATLARDAREAAEPIDGPRGAALSGAARAHGVWLFAGTVPELDGDLLYNTAVVYDPAGRLAAVHRKVHLYTPLGEEKVFAAGDRPTVVHVDGVATVGLSTCFDGDRPAYARQLNQLGARVVIAPCAYEVGAEPWWDVLYPANALLNGQWWVMANQCGQDLLGKSKIIAPDGSVAVQAARVGQRDTPELLVATLDLESGIREAERVSGALWADER
ncbi:carbon-nitrogen hydrolase family protein [Mycolicibacterium komossense]|uniref:Carbon-nitrogen hydrolase family protein n=1 Tax=Mycolicibacterium komossense TaxID=1779 RepID=A0ABT3CC19_9MYCO|nr:carbon-nitrogen hydrolase family protein [Mycolicibacterium komossense]MCV7227032.1 carbon-nitrogen hydrolase family protein [Mycolicibacterium komossense]